jgi:hypothetical protein
MFTIISIVKSARYSILLFYIVDKSHIFYRNLHITENHLGGLHYMALVSPVWYVRTTAMFVSIDVYALKLLHLQNP